MEESISILIPAWNEANIIPKTAHFLKKIELPFNYSELILIAGGTDNTYDVCKGFVFDNFTKVIVLKQEPGDFKRGALIKALNIAKGRNVILIDADTCVASNFAIEVVKSLKKDTKEGFVSMVMR